MGAGILTTMAREPMLTAAKRVAVVAPDLASLQRLRGDLLAAMVVLRHRVLCLVPDVGGKSKKPADVTAAAARKAQRDDVAKALGVEIATYPLRPGRPRMFGEGAAMTSLTGQLAAFRPHVVLGYGPKSMLLAMRAGAKANVSRRVALVSSLGPAFESDTPPHWTWRRLYTKGLAAAHAAIFHNGEDQRRLAKLGVLPKELALHTVTGAGVDLERFPVQPLPPLSGSDSPSGTGGQGLVFLLLGRTDAVKGVTEFRDAAAALTERSPHSRFLIAGPAGDANALLAPSAGSPVELLGDVADVRPLLAQAHVVVVPSYAEGMSRVALEALASGRPLITSDIPGARETIDERVNGVLVPPRDAKALTTAMESFLKRPDLIPSMARASRLKAERRFDVKTVNAKILKVLDLA
jgi:glycosyltransferase involved in cell wall biosynthesis